MNGDRWMNVGEVVGGIRQRKSVGQCMDEWMDG